MEREYRGTIYACFTGYVVQAVINTFVPLLFLTFSTQYGIPLEQISALIMINFCIQLSVDFLSAFFIDRVGYRVCGVAAHVLAGAGLVLLTILPERFENPFLGIMISVLVYAVGGGLLEVLISPMVEACPTKNKEKMMSLLHSFYCWGYIGVVLLSTLFFVTVGIAHWKLLLLLWSLIPFCNGVAFMKIPIYSLVEDGETGMSVKQLFSSKTFWILMLLMLCAGSCEQSVSQWASTFAERSRGVSKTVGDLAGPMSFAVFMGLSRFFYGKYGDKIRLEKFIFVSGILCLISYLMISLSPWPALGLMGCGLCGLSIGILWPGIFSIGSVVIRNGGTAMFAMFALAGDMGCGFGPFLVGTVSSWFQDNLKMGILAAAVFPALLLIGCRIRGGVDLYQRGNSR